MRIAMVSEHASPLALLGGQDAGGQNVHVAALATALAARGHVVEVYTRRDDRTLAEVVPLRVHGGWPGVKVVHVPAGPPEHLPKDDLAPFMPAFGGWLARRWLTGPRPDVVHSHFWMSGEAALAARELCGTPVVHTFHALGCVKHRYQGEADTSPRGRNGTERWIARTSDAVIATCSDEVRELLALDAPADRLHVVPCGVDAEAFSPDGPREPRTSRPRIVAASRLVPRKGLDTLVLALPEVPDAELVIAGGPSEPELDADPEARRLREVARAAGVTDRVHLAGRLSRRQMGALLRSGDVLASVPWYEPFGIVPLEAMACGLPVVVSGVGGMLDTVVDGQTGLHVPPRDPAALAAALRRLLGDPALRAGMGAAGRARAEGYSWDRVADESEAVYRRVLGGLGEKPGAPDAVDLTDDLTVDLTVDFTVAERAGLVPVEGGPT